MKTAIPIPDELFEQAEQLAETLGTSRSELYRNALERYLNSHNPDLIQETLDRVLEGLEGTDNELASKAAESILRATEW